MNKAAIFALAVTVTAPAMGAGYSPSDICKATISVEMGRPTKTMKARSSGEYPEISYKRPDGDAFRYRCQVSEDRVIWAGFIEEEQVWGRWRNRYSEGDASTTYSVSGSSLIIHNDQSGDSSFKPKDF